MRVFGSVNQYEPTQTHFADFADDLLTDRDRADRGRSVRCVQHAIGSNGAADLLWRGCIAGGGGDHVRAGNAATALMVYGKGDVVSENNNCKHHLARY